MHGALFLGHANPASVAVWLISPTEKIVEVLQKGVSACVIPEISEAAIVHAAVWLSHGQVFVLRNGPWLDGNRVRLALSNPFYVY